MLNIISIVATVVILALIARFVALQLVRGLKAASSRLTPDELLGLARDRSIVIGENHADRDALPRFQALLRAAHERGYRVLGVETSEDSNRNHSGLREELQMLEMFGRNPLPEHDPRSALEEGADGLRLRMNRYWQMREALKLGWGIIAIDPPHATSSADTAQSSFDASEPEMARMIREHGPMLAVCGYGHLRGLYNLLDDAVVYIRVSPARMEDAEDNPKWRQPIAFASTIPQLEYE